MSAESTAPRATLRRTAWAKINLALHVTGRRADGYHQLDSLIVFADRGDALELAPASGLSLEVSGPFAAALAAAGTALEDNLVLRAARALGDRCAAPRGARMTLDKRLPVAAGLGGGSADAAAALDGLTELWGLDLPAAELTALAAGLGADVPVCLAGRAALVAGKGEVVGPAPVLPPVWLVLVNPGLPLSTAAVFGARCGAFSRPARWPPRFADARDLAAFLAGCRNDLEAAAVALVPAVDEVLAALRATGECLLARMSGSGATCFGLFAEAGAAAAAARRIAHAAPSWWVRAAALRR